jgi:hypothetical protein
VSRRSLIFAGYQPKKKSTSYANVLKSPARSSARLAVVEDVVGTSFVDLPLSLAPSLNPQQPPNHDSPSLVLSPLASAAGVASGFAATSVLVSASVIIICQLIISTNVHGSSVDNTQKKKRKEQRLEMKNNRNWHAGAQEQAAPKRKLEKSMHDYSVFKPPPPIRFNCRWKGMVGWG